MKTLLVLLEKEFRQFFRNAFLPKMVLVFPLMVMFVLPWITSMDVKHISVAVVDNDHGRIANRLVQKIEASDYFTLHSTPKQYSEALTELENGKVDVIVEIPQGFETSLSGAEPKKMNLSSNGVDGMKGNLGLQYIVQNTLQTINEIRNEQGAVSQSDFIVIKNLYNETLDYKNYMIPALMIMLLVMLCCFLPTLNIVLEKERGTIEQINVTPVSKLTFTLSKLIPYWIIGLIVLSIVMLVARLVYGLAPQGSIGAIYLAAGLFILTMSGLGVTIANKSDTMQQAMFVMFFFVMIFILMSGLLTPIGSMPKEVQTITRLFPPRYFVEIMRTVYLKGSSVAELYSNYLFLALFAAVFNTLAALTYKKQE